MLVLTFSGKNFSYLFFHCFFLRNARKSCAPFMEFLFSDDKFLQEKILPRSPILQTPPTPKIPLKRSVHIQITIAVCKRWSKFVTCSPSPGDRGGVSQPQRHSYYFLRLCWKKQLSQNFDRLTLGKNERGRGPRCPPIFGHWKRALELLISVRTSPFMTF